MDLTTLYEAAREAREKANADEDYWTAEAIGQDTEEAEESGYLVGYAEGLETALRLLGASQDDA